MLALTVLATGVLAVASVGVYGRSQASLAAARTDQLVAVQQVLEGLHSSAARPATGTSFVRVGGSRLEVSTTVEARSDDLYVIRVLAPPLGRAGRLEILSRVSRPQP